MSTPKDVDQDSFKFTMNPDTSASGQQQLELEQQQMLLNNPPPPPIPVTAQRHMFTPDSRKALLREVVRLQPYKNPVMWDSVTHRYGWWCYKNICPPRRSVPKDRLRKKVKSIIAKYPQQTLTTNDDNEQANNNEDNNNEENGGSRSPSENGTTKVAAAAVVAVDDDNLPYDVETLGLIEQVIKQYTESIELVQARRVMRKRDSEVGLGLHSPGPLSKRSPSTDGSSALRFRPPMTPVPNSVLLHNHAEAYSMDLMNRSVKRQRLDEDEDLNSDLTKMFQSRSLYPTDGSRAGSSSSAKGSKYIDDILLNSTASTGTTGGSMFDSLHHNEHQNGTSSLHDTSTPPISYFAESIASAASNAILLKLPDLLETVIRDTNESRMESMKTFGNSFGQAFAKSFSETFESTVNKAVDQILKRLNQTMQTESTTGQSQDSGEADVNCDDKESTSTTAE